MAVVLLLGRFQRARPSPVLSEVRCRLLIALSGTYQFGSAAPCAARSKSTISVGSDLGGSHQGRQRQSLEDSLSSPSQGWDNRLEKRSTEQSDLMPKRPVRYYGPGEEVENFCEKGQLDRALGILVWMDQHGNVPSVKNYISLLRACIKTKSLAQAKQVYAHLAKHGLESISLLGDHVVSTFVKCGGLEDAIPIFNRLPNTSVLSWTALISGYTKSGRGHEALKIYRRMLEQGVRPKPYTFVILLKACGSIEQGKWIHAEAVKYMCDSDLYVRTALIDMYGNCGSIVDAQNVFDGLSQRDVVSWNVMVAAYAQQGQADKALDLYNRMQKEGMSPNNRTFVSVLQACGMLAEKEEDAGDGRGTKPKSLAKGKAIHADARVKGYDSDVYVSNTLVSLYGKCGNIEEAWNVFCNLSNRSVVSWNAMLAAFAQQHQAEKALELYREMLEAGVSPNDRTFVTVLQSCAIFAETEDSVFAHSQSVKVKPLEKGRAVHSEAQRKGYDTDVFVGNILVSMYGKCGSLVDAQNVFEGLVQPNVVSWNAMLAVYVEQGQAENALQLYKRMLGKGESPDGLTLVSVLQACGMLAEKEEDILVEGQLMRPESLDKVKTIHVDARRRGYSSDGLFANTLLNIYGKCRSVVDAHNIFGGLPQHDVVSWNVMLAACVEQGQAERALRLYEQMREECVSPDARSFLSVIQACGMLAEKEECSSLSGEPTKVKSLGTGKALHSDIQKKDYNSDVFVGSALISMYGKCRSILDAEEVFDGLYCRDIVFWNAMLTAYVEQGREEEALQLYDQLQDDASPNTWTFVSILQACSMLAVKEAGMVDGEFTRAKLLEKGKAVHADIKKKGHESDDFVGSALVSMYGKCGSIGEAQSVFNGLPHRSLVSCNAMIAAYAQEGDVENAFNLYRRMEEEGVVADDVTLVCILQACSNNGSLDLCRQIHHRFLCSGQALSPPVANTLIGAYGKCASMEDAQTVFDAMPQPDEVSWNALIAGHARKGNYATGLHCYEEMRLAGFKPNRVTFLSLLCMCSHAGLVDKGVDYFQSMSREYGISPTVEHYASMVDLFGRAGHFERVQDILSEMPMQPDAALWLCLLGACRKHGKVPLAEEAFNRAVCLEPKQAAAYILMSNIYADAGVFDEAIKVKKLGEKEGAWKKPGQSWIEYEQELHSFVVGDHTKEF